MVRESVRLLRKTLEQEQHSHKLSRAQCEILSLLGHVKLNNNQVDPQTRQLSHIYESKLAKTRRLVVSSANSLGQQILKRQSMENASVYL